MLINITGNIYDCQVYCYLGETEDAYIEDVEAKEGDRVGNKSEFEAWKNRVKGCDGMCFTIGNTSYIFVRPKPRLSNIYFLQVLLHECIHWSYRAFEGIGAGNFSRETEEVQASTVEWLFGQILEVWKDAKAK